MLRAYPRVLVQNTETQICIVGTEVGFQEEKEYYSVYTSCEDYRNTENSSEIVCIKGVEISHSANRPKKIALKNQNGCLFFTVRLAGEQEHIFRIYDAEKEIGCVCLYTIPEEWVGLYPYKGDLHLHSTGSDGRQPPKEVAAACRQAGMDFMALTDHGNDQPSVDLCALYQGLPLGLKIYRGEEIHLPGHPVHILNIGGHKSVNAIARANPQAYRDAVKKIEQELKIDSKKLDPYMVAAACWAMRETRRCGGFSILSHPYWRRTPGYNNATRLTDALVELQEFDAIELISGYERREVDSNTLQVAKYHEWCAHGKRLPIVGVSDAHTVKSLPDFPWDTLFGWYYTIVLAKSCALPDVQDGILQLHSVAAEKCGDECLRIYGPYRLVKYALFLAREFFPEHDALVAKEGEWMLQGGAALTSEALKRLGEKTKALYRAVFAFDL